MKSEILDMKYPTLAHFRHFSSLHTNVPSTPVENIRQITPYLKKQSQFQKCKMMQAQYIQGIMKNIAASGHEKTNPIYRGVMSRRSFSEDGSIKRRQIQTQSIVRKTTRFNDNLD
ncbi:MAG: hypothetical protein GY845_07330 [Planctomycetes bacterium]|nr:hypothetical protein [Planctomycetota bacterium]